MKTGTSLGRSVAWIAAMVMASCSGAPSAPSATAKDSVAGVEGNVGSAATGDIKNGPIDIDLVRVSQINGVPAFYANPNGEYIVRPGAPVEIYIQIWTSNPAVVNPRLIVDWGVPNSRDNIGCGSCRLSWTYSTEGKYKVTVIMDDRISGQTTRTFTLNVLKSSSAGTFTFSNSSPVAIPASGSAGPSSPYPSVINVSGVVGKISDLTVTLSGYSHTFHADVIVLLVAPNGQTVKLMDGVGSSSDGNNATITFQDGAPAFPAANIGPGSFTFSPSQGGDTAMDPPAPNVADGTTLSTLNGIDANGAWQLYVFDDAGGDIGQLAGGWSLTLTTVGASSAGIVKAESRSVVSLALYPNEHIFSYPDQKLKP